MAAAVAPLLLGAAEPRLVPDVSDQRIDIVYSFAGAELLLFGAILYPDGRTPAHPADIAVVVRGPDEALLVREKAKVAGVWMNHASAAFRAVPSFYAVATSRPIAGLVPPRTAAAYQLGIANLRLAPAGRLDPAARRRFIAGVTDLRRRAGLFAEHPNEVGIREGVLYRARVPIPSRVPIGTYTAQTLLIRDGRVIAAATRHVTVGKSGFERFVAAAAQRAPLAYGLAAVTLSLLLGWAAAAIAGRRRGAAPRAR